MLENYKLTVEIGLKHIEESSAEEYLEDLKKYFKDNLEFPGDTFTGRYEKDND